MELSGQRHAPAALLQGNNPGTQWTGGWAVPKAGLDNVEKVRISFPRQDSN